MIGICVVKMQRETNNRFIEGQLFDEMPRQQGQADITKHLEGKVKPRK